jgi:hypothetical protein
MNEKFRENVFGQAVRLAGALVALAAPAARETISWDFVCIAGNVVLACIFGLLTTERVAAAPVTWNFEATSCAIIYPALPFGGCSPTQQYPALLATLTLDGPDSSGSAV